MTAATTTHRATRELGDVVVAGIVRWLSATGMAKFDVTQEGGCLRAGHFRYVEGLDDPGTASQALGNTTHGIVESYLKGAGWLPGADAVASLVPQATRVAMGGARFMTPHLGDKMAIEHSMLIAADKERVRADLPVSPTLSARGVPIAGHIDLLRGSGWYVSPMGERRDEEHRATIEVLDWKTTKDFRWAKSGPALLDTVQMVTYGEFAARMSGATHVRLSHVYLKSQGTPDAQKSTTVVPREEIARRWERIDGLVGSIIDVAKVPKGRSNDVEGNPRSCRAFNRPCAYADRCEMNKNRSLHDLLGGAMADSLLDMFNEPTPTTATVEPTSAATLDLGAELAKLAAEEQAAVAATSATPEPAPPPAVPAAFVEACKVLESSSWGFPTLGGEAAQLKGQMQGMAVTAGAALLGSGKLAKIPQVNDPALLVQLARDVKARDAAAATPVAAKVEVVATAATAGLLSPETPASTPALAAEVKPAQTTVEVPATLPDNTGNPAAAVTVTEAAPAPAKAKRGRKTNAERAAKAAAEGKPKPLPGTDADHYGTGFDLFINARPHDGESTSLDAYCDELCGRLCTKYQVLDVRVAIGSDHALAFGRWKGIVAALARAVPPEAGVYHVDTDNEVKAEIASALAGIASGGARGLR